MVVSVNWELNGRAGLRARQRGVFIKGGFDVLSEAQKRNAMQQQKNCSAKKTMQQKSALKKATLAQS